MRTMINIFVYLKLIDKRGHLLCKHGIKDLASLLLSRPEEVEIGGASVEGLGSQVGRVGAALVSQGNLQEILGWNVPAWRYGNSTAGEDLLAYSDLPDLKKSGWASELAPIFGSG